MGIIGCDCPINSRVHAQYSFSLIDSTENQRNSSLRSCSAEQPNYRVVDATPVISSPASMNSTHCKSKSIDAAFLSPATNKFIQNRAQSSMTSSEGAPAMVRDGGDDDDQQPSLFCINVAGHRYTFITQHLVTLNVGLLSALAVRSHADRLALDDDIVYLPRTNEYYFSRSPHVADVVVDFYLTGVDRFVDKQTYACAGELHAPAHMCAHRFHNELRYWQLSHVQPCCAPPVTASVCTCARDAEHEPLVHNNTNRHVSVAISHPPANTMDRVDEWRRRRMSRQSTKDEESTTIVLPIDEQAFKGVRLGTARYAAYVFMENPRKNLGAKVYTLSSMFFVAVSVVGTVCVEGVLE
jgi:hypothetical protein